MQNEIRQYIRERKITLKNGNVIRKNDPIGLMICRKMPDDTLLFGVSVCHSKKDTFTKREAYEYAFESSNKSTIKLPLRIKLLTMTIFVQRAQKYFKTDKMSQTFWPISKRDIFAMKKAEAVA